MWITFLIIFGIVCIVADTVVAVEEKELEE